MLKVGAPSDRGADYEVAGGRFFTQTNGRSESPAGFAVTDADGKFEIKLAPAGNCRLVVWQESIGYRGGAEGRKGTVITVKGGTSIDVGKLELKSVKSE